MERPESLNAEAVICSAIANRHFLQFQCSGETCVVEPHQLGVDSEGGLVLLAYALPDPSEASGLAERWRGYTISDLTHLLESNLPFTGPRWGYRRAPNEHLASAVCEL